MVTPGTRFGPYEILAPLGAGGMGEVYRARDTRLGRTVALKVLPKELARDPERVSRFEREARSASALSHAHVVAVYDVGREGEESYLVTEIVEGGNLRELLARGPLPVRRVMDIAIQLASGLAAAHEQGIVHRDLKPENVLLTKQGEPKIGDFGLAKLTEPANDSNSALPTSDGLQTSAGMVMGTVAYMSPEQASGRSVDFRSDQFAFGTILYELLAGRSAFRRPSAAETLSAVMRDEPEPVRSIQAAVPPHLAWIVDRCLAKEPDGRYAATRDLARELAMVRDHLSEATAAPAEAVAASGSPRRPVAGRALAVGAAIVVAGALVAALVLRRDASAPAAVLRFTVPPPTGARFFSRFDAVGFAFSPDGSRLAFLGQSAGADREVALTGLPPAVWLRDLSDLDPRRVAGTEGASSIFWSPDGRSIGFFQRGRLMREDIAGGSAVPICDAPSAEVVAGTWGAKDILFSSTLEGLIYRVAADGGSAVPLVRPDPARGEARAVWPYFLPDGTSFLYVLTHRDGTSHLMAGTLDGGPAREVGLFASRVEYAEPGFVVFARDGALFAQAFDARTARLSGPPVSLAPAVYYFYTSRWAGFTVSRHGALAYQSQGNITALTFFDHQGRALGEIGSKRAGETIDLAISPDGKQALFDRTRTDLGTYDIWSIDLARGVETRLTSDPNTEFDPVWLPDGKHFVYSAVRSSVPQLVRRDIGGASEDSLLPPGTFQEALGATPDGKRLLFSQSGPKGSWGIWSLSLAGGSEPAPVVVNASQQEVGRLSPDGSLLAFLSSEAGQQDSYLEPVGSPSEKIRLSTGGATLLRWSRDGKEIYYTSPSRHLFAVRIEARPRLAIETPVDLFALPPEGWKAFDVMPDGRFLASVPHESYATSPLTVVVNGLSGVRP
jgi:Tol biopolymer transport system component